MSKMTIYSSGIDRKKNHATFYNAYAKCNHCLFQIQTLSTNKKNWPSPYRRLNNSILAKKNEYHQVFYGKICRTGNWSLEAQWSYKQNVDPIIHDID